MKMNRKIGFVCAINFLICIVYLIIFTYLILGLITVVTLMIDVKCTKNIDNILANKIQFVSSILIGTTIFVIRILFFINTKQIMVGIMSIVIGFFLMSFYVSIRMIIFYEIKNIINKRNQRKVSSGSRKRK